MNHPENDYPSSPPSQSILDFSTTPGTPHTTEARIKNHILQQQSNITIILGPAGVGKSTILKALSHYHQILNHFPGGVYQISLGIHATPRTLLEQLHHILRNAGATDVQTLQPANLDKAIDHAISWFHGKQCALFIDDVWSTLATDLLSRLCTLANTQNTAVVLTTREEEVASLAPRSAIFRVSPKEPLGHQSQRILFSHAAVTDLANDVVEGPLKQVLHMCSGLPVCLAAAGKAARTLMTTADVDDYWAQYLALPNCRDQLLEEQVNGYGNLSATFTASLALLDTQREQRLGFRPPLTFAEMYSRLCVLRKKAKVPATMLAYLWQLEDIDQAATVGTRLEQVGLAECGYQTHGSSQVWYMSLHDSLHDFALREAKRHGGVARAHKVLLQGYNQAYPNLCTEKENRMIWWSDRLKRDKYIHGNLCRHLKDAGHVEELVDLLQTPQWMERQLEMNGKWALQEDYTTGISAVVMNSEEHNSEDEKVLRLIREALMLSFGFISNSPCEWRFQVYGRLLGHRESSHGIRRFLNEIRATASDQWLRSINQFLEGPGSSTIRMIPASTSVRCMAVLDGTDCIACGCDDGKVVIVNVMRGGIERRWFAHVSGVSAIARGRRGRVVVTGGLDWLASVWAVDKGDCIVTFRGHSGRVNSVATVGDDQRAVSASEDGTVQVWDMETGQALATFSTQDPIRRIAVFPDAEHLLSGGADGTMRIWSMTSCSQVGHALPGYNVFMNYLAVTPDGTRIISALCDEILRMQSAKPVEQIGNDSGDDILVELDTGVECLSLSEDGRYIVAGHANGKIRLWDATSGSPVGSTLQGHADRVRDISFLESGDVVVSTSSDGQIRVWDVCRMTEVSQPPQEGRISKVTFTEDGNYVVTGSMDGSLRIWNTVSGQQVGEALLGHAGAIRDIALTPDGKRIISVSNERDRTIRIWNFHARRQLLELDLHTGWISSVALTPRGDCAIAGSVDQNVYVWDLKAQDKDNSFFVLKGHTEWVSKVYASHDGIRIISVGDGEEAIVWNISTRRKVRTKKLFNAWQMSREDILRLVKESPKGAQSDQGETDSDDDDDDVNVEVVGRDLVLGRKHSVVLGTMECDVKTEAFVSHKNTLCVGLRDGRIALMKLELKRGDPVEKQSSEPAVLD